MNDKLTVVMLVGGRGSRLAPYTDDIPKCLVDVAGKPLLVRILDNLTPLFDGFDVNYVFLVNYLGKQVEKFVTENLDLDAVFLYDKPDADQVSVVLEAKPFVTSAMLLYYGDTIIFTEKGWIIPDYNFAFIANVDDVSEYGFILSNGKISEKPNISFPGNIVVGGYYFREGKMLLYTLEHIEGNPVYKETRTIAEKFVMGNQIRVNHHISIDDPDDWAVANKYYKENKK